MTADSDGPEDRLTSPLLSAPRTWVDRHGDYLDRHTLLRVKDRSRAEAIIQETYLAALKSRDSFSGRSSERTWLIGILKHKVIEPIGNSKHFCASGRSGQGYPFAERV